MVNLFIEKKSSTEGRPENSIIEMKRNAKWTVYLTPNWIYDVSVTMGARTDSVNNLNVIGGSSTYILARSFF